MGIRSKTRVFESGKRFGGNPLSRGQVHFLLTNPIYIGMIRHKVETYQGQHAAIIDAALWQSVQTKLQANAVRKRVRDKATGSLKQPEVRSPLAGKLFDETGDRLTPSQTSRKTTNGARRIRYYCSNRIMTGKRKDAVDDPAGWRLPAAKLETAIASTIADHLSEVGERIVQAGDPVTHYRVADAIRDLHKALNDRPAAEPLRTLVAKGEVGPDRLVIMLDAKGLADALQVNAELIDPEYLEIETGFTVRRRGVEIKIVTGAFKRAPDETLIRMLATAHGWLEEVRAGTSLAAIARRYGWTDAPVRQRIRIALLSPKIIETILAGVQPPDLSLQKLLTMDIPLDWDEQERALGYV